MLLVRISHIIVYNSRQIIYIGSACKLKIDLLSFLTVDAHSE